MNFLALEFKLPLICFLFMALLCIIYFSKEKVSLFENKFFDVILFSTTFYSFLNLIVYFIASLVSTEMLNSDYYIFMFILNVFLTTLLFITSISLLLYNVSISYRKILTIKRVNYIYWVGIFLFVLIASFSNIEFYREFSLTQVRGTLVDFAYNVIGGIIVITFVLATINRKKLDKRFITIVYMLLFLGPILVVSYIVPGLILQDVLPVFLTYIMYFTMENPDLKLLNQVSAAKIQAEKANRAKSDFLSSMSHEIRTPLNAIVGLASFINEDDELPSRFKEDTSDIINASNTLLEIVGNILDINKIESNKMVVTDVSYSLVDEVNNIVKLNKTRLNSEVVLNCKVAEDIPSMLYGDKLHIKSILNNLISNAVKYTKTGSINVVVSCVNDLKNNLSEIIISVSDTGIGIKKENIDKLFTKFERLDVERNTTAEGTGLGLAITKRLIELMGGTINVQSNYGSGSLFLVKIPQGIAKLYVNENNVDDMVLSYDVADVSNKKVLIVEDNLLNVKVARKLLDGLNLNISECHDGVECLDNIKSHNYDLILMDIMMPRMGGEETLLKLKADSTFDTPVIALTADAVHGAKEKYLELGFVDYISKPFNKEVIKEKIIKYIK